MHLTPADRDRLLTFSAAELASKRRARGLLLTVPEATALVAAAVIEAARDGARLSEATEAGRRAVRPDQVLPGVADVVSVVHVEAVFDDGSRLVVVDEPFGPRSDDGPGQVRAAEVSPGNGAAATGAGGAASGAGGTTSSAGGAGGSRLTVTVTVTNTASVPITVTSHFHFFETNPRLRFDREAAYGMRLAIDAGASIRFAPGATREVSLVPIGGARVVIGYAGLVDGPLDAPGARERALAAARACGYLDASHGS